MMVLSIVVLFLLHQFSGSTAQHGSEDPAGWTVTDVGDHFALSGSCLAYGELLQYLTRQDKLESELEGLKNETQQCCGGQWAVNFNDQSNIIQQQQATIQQQQATIQQMQELLTAVSDKLNGARDCMELLTTGHDTSGVYTIYPDGGGKSPVHVYCDMDTDGGGWTLFQKRQDGSVNFYLDWQAYKTGFGDLRGEFWLGNDNLHRLTAQDVYELRVDLEDFEGNTAYAKYNIFRVEDEVHKYRLTVEGYSGTAGDGMTDATYSHNGMYFSTRDRENDIHSTDHCAQVYKGAWWYSTCHRANLNGLYLLYHRVAMMVLSIVVLFLLHQFSGSTAQHGSEDPAGWTVTDVGEHVALSGSCLAYGELLQYLTRQDKLESELQGLKNETQQCCGGQETYTFQAAVLQQQQAFVEELGATVSDQANTMQHLQDTVNNQVNIIQQQQTTIQQMQTLLNQITDRLSGPRDCMELLSTGHDVSDVYTIYPDGDGKSPVHVYCDMDTDGGGWTLFQKRQDGSVSFYRDWQAYKTGFGDLRGEFWLGNDNLHRLTAQDVYELRVDLEDFEGNTAYAKYNIFRVEDEVHKYRLTISGYNGTAGDAMTDPFHPHDGMYFSTRDRENDIHTSEHCAQVYKGAWWYEKCHRANLNGLYHGGAHQSFADGVNWFPWKGYDYSLKTTEMKIRPN
ncbi:cell surface pattern recognition receptor signaling pathway [Branchiostoma belcheri]|nr:cell surface pattern recognition receptor signaling pathway [Branchiostoma belcheri]